MTYRLVDIVDRNGQVVHTYPVTLSPSEPATDSQYIVKALEAAAAGELVDGSELDGLTAKMHISRGGRLQPSDDRVDTDSQTKEGLEQEVRERAYLLWDEHGRPEGRTEEFWARALDEHLQKRAYTLWTQDGDSQEAEDDWNQVRAFEQN
jgi:hypothetical protein